jgi:signal transduction histidine kinase
VGEEKDWLIMGSWGCWKSSPVGGQPVSIARAASKYGFAMLLVGLAFGLSHWLHPLVSGTPVFILYVAVSFVAAWFGGLGPGVAALLVGLLVADYFFVEPLRQVGPFDLQETVQILLNICAAGIGFAAIVNLHRARFRQHQVQSLATRLEQEVAKQHQALEELREAKAQLDDHARLLESRVADRTATLLQTVRSLEGVLYHVAHDLRAPLRALSALSQILMGSLGTRLEGEEQNCMERIMAAAKRMDRLTLDLLAYGRLGHVALNLKPTDLQKLLGRVVGDLQPDIGAKRAEVQIIAPMPIIQTDESLLGPAVAELLHNALRFNAPGSPPRVLVRTEPLGPRVRIWVQDNGIGIEPQYRERIFGIFEQLYPLEGEDSTGMGLAVVAKTMERLGGSAGVESEPRQGSRFWLELPLAPEALQEDRSNAA